MRTRIETENSFADSFIDEMTINIKIQTALHQLAQKVINEILQPFSAVTIAQGILPFESYPPNLQKALNYLVEKHIHSERQFGALLPDVVEKELVTHSPKNLAYLFELIEIRLTNVQGIHSRRDFLSIIKCLSDLGWCYFECLPELHKDNYDTIKNMIWPTPEEFFDARIRRDERSKEKLLAKSFGIGTEAGRDLIPAHYGLGWESGKSIFAGVSMLERLEILTKRFDQTQALLRTMWVERDKNPTEKFTEADAEIKRVSEQLDNMRIKMQYYHIPLDVHSRLPISHYAKQYKTTFEKLAALPKTDKQEALPMIASVSGSTARNLIAFQDIDAFINRDGHYDFDLIQMINNCFAAYYIYCGHHSFLEVAEVHNRLLDYIAIYDPNHMPQSFHTTRLENQLPYMEDPSKLETRLPYYHIGNYESFIHPSYAKAVLIEDKKPTTFTSSIRQ